MSKRKYNQIETDGSIQKIPNRTRNKREKVKTLKEQLLWLPRRTGLLFYKKELEKKQRLKKVEENSIDPDEERILGNSHSSTDSDQEVKNPGSDLNKSSSLKIQNTAFDTKEVFDKVNDVVVISEMRHPLKPLIEIAFPLHC